MKNVYLTFTGTICMILIIGACSNPDAPTTPITNLGVGTPSPDEWLIPRGSILDGGVGLDGIPSIDDPNFTRASDVDYLEDQDLILGIRVGQTIKGYPHPILDWHEIVNDEIGSENIALTYCPLTGTGVGWGRDINGSTTEFGVSGLLFNTNLMPYDRNTRSTWSQQRLECVNGALIGHEPELYTFVETSWASWKAAYPDSEILNEDTNIDRNYAVYPYGNYRTSAQTIFPIDRDDNRLHPKTRVLGLELNDEWMSVAFPESAGNQLFMMTRGSDDAVVIGNTLRNFIVAFRAEAGRTYEAVDDLEFPAIFQDDMGIRYDMLGSPMDDSGPSLELYPQFIGYWFSWGTFYPNLELLNF